MGYCLLIGVLSCLSGSLEGLDWGFFPHRMINKHAVYTLPPAMMPFYQLNQSKLMHLAVQADKRRYAVADEGPRHYIDLDYYGLEIAELWTRQNPYEVLADSLLDHQHGVLPWNLIRLKYRLTDAFRRCDLDQILRYSADAGHYLADAHVPLHTTSNYNGQKTNQKGIHGFWETQVPEVLWEEFNLWVGPAEYWLDPTCTIWDIILEAHAAVDSVLYWEQHLSDSMPTHLKFSYQSRNQVLQRNYSRDFVRTYHQQLNSQVERQLRKSIRAVGSFWYTCWLDAGQPNLWWEGLELSLDSLLMLDQQWKKGPKN